jgi:hypothetical protein
VRCIAAVDGQSRQRHHGEVPPCLEVEQVFSHHAIEVAVAVELLRCICEWMVLLESSTVQEDMQTL